MAIDWIYKGALKVSEVQSGMIGEASKKAKVWGGALLVLGIIAIAAPFATGKAVAVVVGILLVLAGIAQLMFAFQADSLGRGLLRLLFGGITLAFGIAVIGAPAAGLATLTMVLVAYFFVDGIFTVVAAFQLKPREGWGWMVFDGVITILLAWMIWAQWPVSGAWAIGILVGVRLIMTGVTMITLGAAGTAIAREMGHVA